MCQASSGQTGGFPWAPGLGEREAGALKDQDSKGRLQASGLRAQVGQVGPGAHGRRVTALPRVWGGGLLGALQAQI